LEAGRRPVGALACAPVGVRGGGLREALPRAECLAAAFV